jgi:hypothetical protein
MEHDIHLGCLCEYHVPWVDQSLYTPHRKSSIVNYYMTSDNVFSDWLTSVVTFFDKTL